MKLQIGSSRSFREPDLLVPFWFGLLYFLLLRIMTEGGRVEDFNYSEKVKEVVEVWEIQHGAGCYVEIAHIWNAIKLVWLLASEKNTFLFYSHLKWKCIECFAEKYLEGTVGCWIFVIQHALCSWNEFWDELSIVVSPLTFQRYAAFEPWIYCNLFFSYYWCVVEL